MTSACSLKGKDFIFHIKKKSRLLQGVPILITILFLKNNSIMLLSGWGWGWGAESGRQTRRAEGVESKRWIDRDLRGGVSGYIDKES